MKISRISIRNFRRLENISIDIEDGETVFVGPNNSGKTSATAAFRCFLGGRDFRIHDLSVDRIQDLDTFGENPEASTLPTIELDLWFTIDTGSVEFGRAFSLLPRLSDDFDSLGVRLKYAAADPDKILSEYLKAYPEEDDDSERKSLSQYLSIDQNFRRFFELSYFSIEKNAEEEGEVHIEAKDAKKILQSLIRVDFVDAQRNINDEDSNRSLRLSTAFAAFYRHNLEQSEAATEAHAVIDQNNQQLTDHYETQFGDLITVIRGLGVPSINDRELKIVSSLSPLTALQGNTDLLYVDEARGHELPELYNGLGFKNLIYMAIQVRHFHLQWIQTMENRPLSQLIFLEEPEVHLHAQVQQTFIANVWKIIEDSSEETGTESLAPQLIITTHSSHILDAVDFEKVRYFRRCAPQNHSGSIPGILSATEVHSLRGFQPEPIEIDGQEATEEQALEFLKRYLKLTHCDLFFADAAILVEGAVEKLLFPAMIDKAAPGLRSAYLTTLEVGGAYAHRFEGLLEFLHIPYLVVTDLDSVKAEGRHPACRADTKGALTSNTSLKKFFSVTTVADLMDLSHEQKQNPQNSRFVAFQFDIPVEYNEDQLTMRPRTFEEAFLYTNFCLAQNGEIEIGVEVADELGSAYDEIFARVRSSEFKKTDFAMAILAGPLDWRVPNYVAEGLEWLEQRLNLTSSSN